MRLAVLCPGVLLSISAHFSRGASSFSLIQLEKSCAYVLCPAKCWSGLATPSSLIIGRQLFILGKELRGSVSNYIAVTLVQKSPGSRWLKRTVLGEKKGCLNISFFCNKQCQAGSLSCNPQLISHPIVLMDGSNLLLFHKYLPLTG